MLRWNFLSLPGPHHVLKAGLGVRGQCVRAALPADLAAREREVPAHVSQGGCWHRGLAAGKAGGGICAGC